MWQPHPELNHPFGVVDVCAFCEAHRAPGFRVWYPDEVRPTGMLEYGYWAAPMGTRFWFTSAQEPPCIEHAGLLQGDLFAEAA